MIALGCVIIMVAPTTDAMIISVIMGLLFVGIGTLRLMRKK